MTLSRHPYADFIHKVNKPARYMGGEYQSIVKPWDEVEATMALCFPDVYDIGMSHLGTKILYSIVNREKDLCLERVFCPWFDMEQELRQRELPLVTLETHRPLSAFDLVGFSLQYELTFTNVLTMLDLGGVPLHNAERTLEHPLVVAGGPVATQPEPMTPFIDAFLIGDAEERLPRLMRHWASMKREGRLRRTEMLVEISKEGGIYCPDLYEREICDRSGFLVVGRPKHEEVPERVERAFVEDINRYRFPDDSPVPVAEAIFDRMAIEIARGCTEGCRFCQAGMIYRPVRERDPEQVAETLVSAVDKGGYDEASITSLSTADYSCISPLVKRVMNKLRPKKVSLGISSLRAYGLDEDLLDDIASVKATGLTFAPEAGTQRMRDVINKNITEEDIFTTCHRVFSRGWNRVKLYFMIGLPTETDEDVLGIARMGKQARDIGRKYQKNVSVTVSVSSHSPKPHAPFQWCAMDSLEEIERKQAILRRHARRFGFSLKLHDRRVTYLEGIMARGDARTGRLIESAWRAGARFDGWDEHLNWPLWQEALARWEKGERVSRETFLQTIPLDGRLPWDHVDVGLAEGFLAREYKRSLKDRLSPPCGKPYQAKVHHTNLEDARADARQLICYHCGVACDLTQMREERLVFLERLGATTRPQPRSDASVRETALERIRAGRAPHDFQQGSPVRYRVRYAKLRPMNLRGHLDLVRVLPRIFRRAGLPLYYSEGYSPRPVFAFGPALALGMQSLAEYADVALTEEVPVSRVLEALTRATEEGLVFSGVRRLGPDEPSLSKEIQAFDLLILLPAGDDEAGREAQRQAYACQVEATLAAPELPVTVERKGKKKTRDLKETLLDARVVSTDAVAEARGLWAGRADSPALFLRLKEGSQASVRPAEIVEVLFGLEIKPSDVVRLGCWRLTHGDGIQDPLENPSAGERCVSRTADASAPSDVDRSASIPVPMTAR